MEKREAGRLLCDLLAGRRMADARLEKISPADWENLVDWAQRFKVEGLLYREVKSRNFPDECLPGDTRNRLRTAYRNQATKNASLFIDAATVLRSLAERQMPVIALKGLALAKDIYGDIALRPMHDMDLLLKEDDLVRAGRVLLALGYKQDSPAWESTFKIFHHLPPFMNANGTIIELHWTIVMPDSPIKVDMDGLWERARPNQVDTIEVRMFSVEDLLLHVCVHACLNLQTGSDLIPFCDVAGLIKKYADRIDWQIVIARAYRWGGQKCVYLMLLLVRELLGTAPPEKIMLEIKPNDYQPAFLDEALEQLFDVSPASHKFIARIDKLQNIKKYKGFKGKVWALVKGAFPTREYLARVYSVSISSPKIYLYYLSRLCRLFFHYTHAFLRSFNPDREVAKAVDQERRVRAFSNWMFSK